MVTTPFVTSILIVTILTILSDKYTDVDNANNSNCDKYIDDNNCDNSNYYEHIDGDNGHNSSCDEHINSDNGNNLDNNKYMMKISAATLNIFVSNGIVILVIR